MSLFEVEHFHDHFLLILMQELMGSVDGNKLWGQLKSVIRSFTADYSSWLNLEKLATQTATKSILECAIKWGDSGDSHSWGLVGHFAYQEEPSSGS